jgi:hypothetical protein
MSSKYPKKLINIVRSAVLNGKTKYQIAKELGISDKFVYYHTRDLPSKGPGRSEIRGKTLEILKTLLTKGYVKSDRRSNDNLRTLQRHFKILKRSQVNGKTTVYYLEDKNKAALQSLIREKNSRILSYREINDMSKVFHVNLSNKEKHGLIGNKQDRKRGKSKSSKQSSTGEDSGFLGRFLHSGLLREACFYKK